MTTAVLDPETDELIREYAQSRQLDVNAAIKTAIREAVEREREVQRRIAGMQAVVDRVAKWPKTGETADKAFFDSLYDE